MNLSWSTDQIHRMGAGKDPDLGRGLLPVLRAVVRRHGRSALTPERGIR
jgi:hypothetical protein